MFKEKIQLDPNDKIENYIERHIPLLKEPYLKSEAGEGAIQIYSLDSTKEEYDAYCSKLKDAGFSFHTENVINKTVCSTYYNEEIVVNVVFAGGISNGISDSSVDRSLRIVAEPFSETALPELEEPADAVATVVSPSISMVDHWPERGGRRWDRDGNLCLVVQLSNGHFIVIDGNHNAKEGRNTPKMIFDHLKKLSPDEKPVIDAWILTHFHHDHIGGFIDFCNNDEFLGNATVKSVIYNFPCDKYYEGIWYVDANNVDNFYGVLKKKMRDDGTIFYKARTGQRYYFGNAEIEMLWTYEDIAPHSEEVEKRTNATSIGFTVAIEGQKIMVTGDASTEEFRMADIRYGDYLKSDMVQLSHHGYGDGNVPHDFYKHVNAPYVMCSGLGVDYGYGPGEKWAKENAEVYILREAVGTCVIRLPYNGGSFESAITPDN